LTSTADAPATGPTKEPASASVATSRENRRGRPCTIKPAPSRVALRVIESLRPNAPESSPPGGAPEVWRVEVGPLQLDDRPAAPDAPLDVDLVGAQHGVAHPRRQPPVEVERDAQEALEAALVAWRPRLAQQLAELVRQEAD